MEKFFMVEEGFPVITEPGKTKGERWWRTWSGPHPTLAHAKAEIPKSAEKGKYQDFRVIECTVVHP